LLLMRLLVSISVALADSAWLSYASAARLRGTSVPAMSNEMQY